jgi:hypothetical protein
MGHPNDHLPEDEKEAQRYQREPREQSNEMLSSQGVCWEVTLCIIEAQAVLNKARSPVTPVHYRGSGSVGKAQDPKGAALYQNTNLKVKKGPSL